jgi:hypothetical protein
MYGQHLFPRINTPHGPNVTCCGLTCWRARAQRPRAPTSTARCPRPGAAPRRRSGPRAAPARPGQREASAGARTVRPVSGASRVHGPITDHPSAQDPSAISSAQLSTHERHHARTVRPSHGPVTLSSRAHARGAPAVPPASRRLLLRQRAVPARRGSGGAPPCWSGLPRGARPRRPVAAASAVAAGRGPGGSRGTGSRCRPAARSEEAVAL